MSKARDIADLLDSAGKVTADDLDVGAIGGHRNLIINGDFKVSQRGDYTTATSIPNTTYGVDRWLVQYNGGMTTTITHKKDQLVNGSYTNTLRHEATTTSADARIMLRHYLEATEAKSPIAGKEVTYSAWVKSNTPNAHLIVYDYGTGSYINGASHSGGGEWEHLTMTFTPSSNNSNAAGYGAEFNVNITDSNNGAVSITTGDYIEIAQVQLELGSVATPFEHRSYGEELALCQRYYRQWGRSDGSNGAICNGMAYSSGEAYFAITLPVTMRAKPSVSYSDLPRAYKPTTAARLTSVSIDSNESDGHSVRIRGDNASFFTAGNATWLQINTAGEWFALDAEL